jgi:hypothetical protein
MLRAVSSQTLDPRQASRAGEMFVKPSQMANILMLLDAKKKSSFVILMWSNNRMQRSAASQFHIITLLLHAAPADAER